MSKILARTLLSGFTLNLVPTINPIQNEAGQVVGNQVTNSDFSPRLSVYTGPIDEAIFRGETSFTFGVTETEPVEFHHKGMPSQKQFFESTFAGVKMADVLEKFRSTTEALLDDTVDGKQTKGQIDLDYRMERITAVLSGHDFVNNFVQIDFGVFEIGGARKLYDYSLQYVPDPILEPLKQRISKAKTTKVKAEKEIKKINAAALAFDSASPNYQLEILAITQKIESEIAKLKQATQELKSAESVTYFPLSQLWSEDGIPEAIKGLTVGVYAALQPSTYLLANYDLASLQNLDIDTVLETYATMGQPSDPSE